MMRNARTLLVFSAGIALSTLGALYLAQDNLIFIKPRYSPTTAASTTDAVRQLYFDGRPGHHATPPLKNRALLQIPSDPQVAISALWLYAHLYPQIYAGAAEDEEDSGHTSVSIHSDQTPTEAQRNLRFGYMVTPTLDKAQAQNSSSDHETKQPQSFQPCNRLLVFFGGNAMTGLQWLDEVSNHVEYVREKHKSGSKVENEAYLLIDYPGYGQNGGSPSENAIIQDSMVYIDRAVEYLTKHASQPTTQPIQITLFGHSIGAAAALGVANALESRQLEATDSKNQAGHSAFELNKIILSAPFTTLRETACLFLGLGKLTNYASPFLGLLLRNTFDNPHNLRTLFEKRRRRNAQQQQQGTGTTRLEVHIIHGTEDRICPVEMGETLGSVGQEVARNDPNLVCTFTKVYGANHDTVLGYWGTYESKL